MKRQINVVLDKGVQFSFHVPEGAPLTHDVARSWLDQQFLALGCAALPWAKRWSVSMFQPW
ncbi:MAG: hypothetical protein RLZZ371_262 [Pseudomonadota bacterium]|jgi:hypothetical protein